MDSRYLGLALGSSLMVLAPSTAIAVPVTPVNLDGLTLGAAIDGQLGSEVNSSFVASNGDSIGDLISSVSCPDGVVACAPATNPSGTIYTYVHTVTPGVDTPNDDPFPNPAIVRDVSPGAFQLGFEAVGFNGVAGYSFSNAQAAFGTEAAFQIELNATTDGSLTWATTSSVLWEAGNTIALFWQTTRPPLGPSGEYVLTNDLETGTGSAFGPLPNPVPLPAGIGLLLSALGLIGWRGWRSRTSRDA